jgi:hypothetical protein
MDDDHVEKRPSILLNRRFVLLGILCALIALVGALLRRRLLAWFYAGYGFDAYYPSMRIYGTFDRYSLIGIDSWNEQTSTIIVIFPDGVPRRLRELTEDDVRKLGAVEAESRDPQKTVYEVGSDEFTFTSGRLSNVKLSHDVRIGTSPDGPFFPLPLTDRQLRRLFGAPYNLRKVRLNFP